MLKSCSQCNTKYPEEILFAGFCGICGLELLSRLQNKKLERFSSDHAEVYRLEAIKWRNKKKK